MSADRPKRRGKQGDSPPKAEPRSRIVASPWLGAGLEFIGTAGILFAIGWWVDGHFSTTPIFQIAGMMIGLIGSTYRLWLRAKREADESNDE